MVFPSILFTAGRELTNESSAPFIRTQLRHAKLPAPLVPTEDSRALPSEAGESHAPRHDYLQPSICESRCVLPDRVQTANSPE